jgi:hypothetical protein
MKILDLCKFGIISVIMSAFCSCSILKIPKIPVDGLAAYFPFNKNADDKSGNNNNGIVNGATLTADRYNRPNSAYFFDGSDEIKIPNISFFNNMKSFSISIWIYPTEIKYRHNTIISKVNPNRDFNLKILKDNMKYEAHFAYGATYYRCYSKKPVELHTWTHLVYQWTGIKSQLFINGVFVNEVNYRGVVPPWTGTIMAIGSMNGTEFFTGKIDNIRIYKRTLSKNEIKSLYKEKE